MKVLLINDYATATGGAEIGMISLRDGLRDLGHDARLFASSARPMGAPSAADFECLGTLSKFRILLQTLNPFAYFKLKRVLREFQPDVVQVGMFLTQLSPLVLPLLRGYRSVYMAMWQRSICMTGFKLLPTNGNCTQRYGPACVANRCVKLHDWLLLTLQMKMFRTWRGVFDRIVSVSESLSAQLSSEGILADRVVYFGVPIYEQPKQFAPVPTACFAGRLSKEKGADLLLHAFARVKKAVPSARLIIAGDGPEREPLERLIRELQLNDCVQMLGFVPNAEVNESFTGAWVQIVPSPMHEPFGLVVAEAMMSGRAVIAANTGGPAETITHAHDGLLVPVRDIDKLAEALRSVLSDRTLAETMGAHGRAKAVAQLSEKLFVDNMIGVYEELTSSFTETQSESARGVKVA